MGNTAKKSSTDSASFKAAGKRGGRKQKPGDIPQQSRKKHIGQTGGFDSALLPEFAEEFAGNKWQRESVNGLAN